MARPSDFSQEVADQICEGLAEGTSLRKICERDGMPDKATVFRWLHKDEAFRDQYARAREAQTDSLLEEIFEIADQWESPLELLKDPDTIQRAKLRIDTRKWAMSKMAPKRFGDKVTQEIAGDPDNPLRSVTTIELVAPAHVNGKG